MKYVDKLLVECILIPLGLIAVALAADAGIKKKNQIWNNKTITSNEEMEYIMKIL